MGHLKTSYKQNYVYSLRHFEHNNNFLKFGNLLTRMGQSIQSDKYSNLFKNDNICLLLSSK